MTRLVIDTYAWVEYLLGSAVGARAKGHIEGRHAATPSIVVSELTRWYLREVEAGRRTNEEMTAHIEFVGSATAIVPLDRDIAHEAGELDFLMKKRIKGWPLADSVIYATAKALGARVVTGDPHFKGLSDVEFVG